jgi:hypothetical protein
MHSRITRCFALVCVSVLFASGEAARPLAPEAEQPPRASHSGTGPMAPSNVFATAVSSSQLDVTWQDNSANESGFEVYAAMTGLSEFCTPFLRSPRSSGCYRWAPEI